MARCVGYGGVKVNKHLLLFYKKCDKNYIICICYFSFHKIRGIFMQLLKQCVVISFLCLPAQTFCMEKETDLLSALSYFQAVKQIDEKNEKFVQNFRKHVHVSDVSLGIEIIQQNLQLIGQNFAKRKEYFFSVYKERHGLSDEEWNRCIQETHIFDQYIQHNNNDFEFHGIVHDSRIPGDFIVMLKKSLVYNGFNPNAVNVVSVKHCDLNVFFFDRHRDEARSVSKIVPACIGVNVQSIEQLSKDAQEGLCALLAYSMKRDCLLSGQSSTDATWQKALRQYAYASSLLTLALQNDDNNAQLLKILCHEIYNSVFSIKDYQLLSDICYLHEALASLKSVQYNAKFGK